MTAEPLLIARPANGSGCGGGSPAASRWPRSTRCATSTRYAVEAGFDSLWISHANAVDPIVALAATADESAGLRRGRHERRPAVRPPPDRPGPAGPHRAERARRPLHAGHRRGVAAAPSATSMGLPWDRPLRYTREFIDGLQPLLAGQVADVDGEQVTTHAELNIAAPDTPILLAALGPEDARARRPAGAGHQRRAVRAAHDRHPHRTDDPGRRRRGRPAGAAHHGPDPPVRHRRRRRRLRPGEGDGDPLPGGAVLRAGAGHRGPRRPGPAAPHRLVGAGARRARRVRHRRRHRLPPRDRRPRRTFPGDDPRGVRPPPRRARDERAARRRAGDLRDHRRPGQAADVPVAVPPRAPRPARLPDRRRRRRPVDGARADPTRPRRHRRHG